MQAVHICFHRLNWELQRPLHCMSLDMYDRYYLPALHLVSFLHATKARFSNYFPIWSKYQCLHNFLSALGSFPLCAIHSDFHSLHHHTSFWRSFHNPYASEISCRHSKRSVMQYVLPCLTSSGLNLLCERHCCMSMSLHKPLARPWPLLRCNKLVQ